MKKNWLIIAFTIIIGVGVIIFTMYLIDMERMEHNYDVVFCTWGRDYEPGMHNYFKDDKENDNVPIDENVLTTEDVKSLSEEITDSSDMFDAKIEEVKEYNGKYSLLVSGLETNEINYKSKYWCSIKETTKLFDAENNEIEVADLKNGQNVSITYAGGVMETYPAQIWDVLKVQVLD